MAEAQRGQPGGIVRLCNALDEHPGAFAYDWRVRFGLPASVIGTSMDWAESYALTAELLKEPDSHVCAALAGWSYPWPIEAFLLADLFDAYLASHSKHRPKPRPRPNDKPVKSLPKRAVSRVSQARVMAALAARGHGTREA